MPSITLHGRSTFYTIDGDSSRPSSETSPQTTSVFIHGLGSSSCFYQTIIPHLSKTTRCIALDTPGSGQSELGTSEQSISSIAEVVIGLLKALQIIEKVVLVGHSMGAIVASYVAATYPDIVEGVILIGPVQPSLAITEMFEKRIDAVRKDGLEILADTIPHAAVGTKAGPVEKAFVRTLILGTWPSGYISLCKVIANAESPNYSSIKAPLLIIAGKEDKTAPLAASEAILKAYGTESGKSVEVLDGVGHWHCIEDPERVASLIHRFLETVR